LRTCRPTMDRPDREYDFSISSITIRLTA
jgi:hypothetical protein